MYMYVCPQLDEFFIIIVSLESIGRISIVEYCMISFISKVNIFYRTNIIFIHDRTRMRSVRGYYSLVS